MTATPNFKIGHFRPLAPTSDNNESWKLSQLKGFIKNLMKQCWIKIQIPRGGAVELFENYNFLDFDQFDWKRLLVVCEFFQALFYLVFNRFFNYDSFQDSLWSLVGARGRKWQILKFGLDAIYANFFTTHES